MFSPAPVPTPQMLAAIALQAPRAQLRVQVAKTGPERERGLMGVTKLPTHTGMLFIFEKDEPVAFWMKDTLISLDMVFLAPDGTVRKIFPRVPVVSAQLPDAAIPLEKASAKYVIELPAGEASSDGLREGARVEGLPKR